LFKIIYVIDLIAIKTIDQMDHKIVRWARTEANLQATKNPINQIFMRFNDGAGTRIRTVDLLITSQLLYQLSYAGNVVRIIADFLENASQKVSD
jgi:predicted nicotinamide N-methyase